jgi:hypothetical protein
MIKAEHTGWAKFIFTPVIEGLLRINFSNFFCVEPFPEIDPDKGLLITPNHFSWWDGFFMFHLLHRGGRKMYLMMLEERLSIFRYYRNIGAYSVNPGKRKSVLESIQYTADILSDKDKLAIVFPQGEIRSYYEGPQKLQKGINLILKKTMAPVSVLPVYFRIEYYEKMRPEIWCGFGEVMESSEVIKNHSAFENRFINGFYDFNERVNGRSQVSDLFRDKQPKS